MKKNNLLLMSLISISLVHAKGLKKVAAGLRISNQSSHDVWFSRGLTKKTYQLAPKQEITIPLATADDTIELFSPHQKFKHRIIDLVKYKAEATQHDNEILEITIRNFWFWPRRITYAHPEWKVNEKYPEQPVACHGKACHPLHRYHHRWHPRVVIQNNSDIEIMCTHHPKHADKSIAAGAQIKLPLNVAPQLTLAPRDNAQDMTPIDLSFYSQEAPQHPKQDLYIEIVNIPQLRTASSTTDKKFGYKNPQWISPLRHKKPQRMRYENSK